MNKCMCFNIFDTKISPILLYGSGIWGVSNHTSTELIQNYACKNICAFNIKKQLIQLGFVADTLCL